MSGSNLNSRYIGSTSSQINQKTRIEKNAKDKRSVLNKTLDEFFDSSTIHGIKYIGTRPLHEKVWWFLIFCISICFCVLQIWSIYTKWKENPVIISIDQKFTPIGDIPFPAITICGRFTVGNQTQLEYSAVLDEIMDGMVDKIDSVRLGLFELAHQQCYDQLEKIVKKNISNIFGNRGSSNFDDLLEKVFHANISDLVSKCHGVLVSGSWLCRRGFSKILTRDGLCLTFNMLRSREVVRENVTLYYEDNFKPTTGWRPETGYDSDSPIVHRSMKRDFPRRIFTIGKSFQAQVKKYNPDWGMHGGCLDKIRLYIHHPHDFPWDLKKSLFFEYGSKIQTIVVTPQLLVSESYLQQSCSSDQRNCFFENERQLRFFKIYSKSNCELECLTNITYKECGCVMAYMPHIKGTPICGIKHHKCYSIHSYRYLNLNIATPTTDIINRYDIPYKCNCLQRCNSLTYSMQKKDSQSQYNMADEDEMEEETDSAVLLENEFVFHAPPKNDTSRAYSNPLEFKNITKPIIPEPVTSPKFIDRSSFDNLKFKIEFETTQILAYKRIAPYRISDFIANCGGLLGLFMGISLLSVVEIIYFFTFRIIAAAKTVREHMTEEQETIEN